jgi:hypothetical protein
MKLGLLKIGLQKNAKKINHKVGGKAFPNDLNWTCPVCGSENRKYEAECYTCIVAVEQADRKEIVVIS